MPFTLRQYHDRITVHKYLSLIRVTSTAPMTTALVPAALVAISRRNIDAQLRQTSETHRRLREQRNGLSCICRLPREILCEIFRIYIDIARKTASGFPVPHWFIFTHVCTAWRITAIYNPALWTHIKFHQPFWALEMLRRSQNLPLNVQLTPSVYKQSSVDVVDAALQQCYRIAHLRLATAKYAILSHLMHELRGPFNVMRSLDISITFQDIPMISIPDIFSDANFPVLDTLNLSGCGFNWEGRLPSSLTSLSIAYDSSLSQATHPRMHHVLNILRSTPRLTVLTLTWSLPVDHEDDSEGSVGYHEYILYPLKLDNLSYLRIIDKSSALTAFLCRIRLPRDTRVHIGCQASSGASITRFGNAVKRCELVTDTRALTFLSVDQVSSEHIHFVVKCFQDDPVELRIDVTWLHWGELSGESALLDICRLFDMSELEVVNLIDLGPMSHAIWFSAFASTTHLSTICVRGDTACGLFRALLKDPSDSSSPLLSPGLRTLNLEKVPFQMEDTKDQFFQCLMARRDLGIGLHVVTIRVSSGFGPGDFSAMKSIVSGALWDETVLANINSSDDGLGFGAHEESDGYGSEYWSLEEYDYED